MKPSEVLREAAKLVRKGWCQGAYAKTRRGKYVLPYDAQASRWCARGAVLMASLQSSNDAYIDSINTMKEHLECAELFDWNDTPGRTQDEVIAALESAATISERSGG